MAEWEEHSFAEALAREAPAFFDRGLPDTIDYCRLEGLAVPPEIEQLAAQMRSGAKVFIALPWAEISI